MKRVIAPLFHDLLLPKGVIKDALYSVLRNAILEVALPRIHGSPQAGRWLR